MFSFRWWFSIFCCHIFFSSPASSTTVTHRQAGTAAAQARSLRGFFFVSSPRSGSTWINSLIGNHPCALSKGEKLGPLQDVLQRFPQGKLQASAEVRQHAQNELLSRLGSEFSPRQYQSCPKGEPLRLGFKAMVERLDTSHVMSVLAGDGSQPIPVFMMLRNNSLDHFLSSNSGDAALRNGLLHSDGKIPLHCKKGASCMPSDARWHIPCPELTRYVKHKEDLQWAQVAYVRELAEAQGVPFMFMWYEEVQRRGGEMVVQNEVFPFFNMSLESEISSTLRKRITGSKASLIGNYQQTKRCLSKIGMQDLILD